MEGCTTIPLTSKEVTPTVRFLKAVADEAQYLLLSHDVFNGDLAGSMQFAIIHGGMTGIVAKVDGGVVGNCIVSREGLEASQHVGNVMVAVREDLRGLGIGGRMVEEAMKLSPCELFVAECFAENVTSIFLFASLGYKQRGEMPKFIYKDKQFHTKIILST